MINDLFGVVARIFPVLIVVAILTALIFLARALSRMSSGSIGGGPPRIPSPAHVGLQAVPWELQALPEALRSNSTEPVNLLVRRADALGVPVTVPTDLPSHLAVETILDQLEDALGLPPLVAPSPPAPAQSTNQES